MIQVPFSLMEISSMKIFVTMNYSLNYPNTSVSQTHVSLTMTALSRNKISLTNTHNNSLFLAFCLTFNKVCLKVED